MRTLVLEEPPVGRMTLSSLGQEAEAIRPVGPPSIERQTQLVLHHVRREAGVLGEVVALRVRLQRELDANSRQRLLERLGGRLLLRPLGAVGDVGLKAVRLQASSDFLAASRSPLWSGPFGYRSKADSPERSAAGSLPGRHRQPATVRGLVAGVIHGVHDRLAALDVVERSNRRVDRGVPVPHRERVVRVLLEVRILQDPAQCGRLDSSATSTSRSPLMIRLSMSSALTLRVTSMRSGAPCDWVGRGIPLIVADQVEALAGLQAFKLVRTGGDDRVRYLAPVSLSLGTGIVLGCWAGSQGRERRLGVEDDRTYRGSQ